MQFTSHNHNVFLRKKEPNIFVEKIGVKFPERIRRESDILKILVSYCIYSKERTYENKRYKYVY